MLTTSMTFNSIDQIIRSIQQKCLRTLCKWFFRYTCGHIFIFIDMKTRWWYGNGYVIQFDVQDINSITFMFFTMFFFQALKIGLDLISKSSSWEASSSLCWLISLKLLSTTLSFHYSLWSSTSSIFLINRLGSHPIIL